MFARAARSLRRRLVRTAVGGVAVVGLAEVTTHLPSQGRSAKIYHQVADDVVTPAMRRFLNPEHAHQMAIVMAQRGLCPTYRPSAVEQRVAFKSQPLGSNNNNGNHGLVFSNPIGLAAGFDKDGEIVQPLLDLGFGFAEVGTVTPQPQPGNPAPRMFRLVEDLAIINRYGFNSKGAAVVRQNLEDFRHPPPPPIVADENAVVAAISSALKRGWHFFFPQRPPATGLVGVNLGKNKETEGSDLDAVVADYVVGIQQLGPVADYLVINISSPNTAGLRDLQKIKSLERLLQECKAARDALPGDRKVPLLVKLAPDLTDSDLEEIAETLLGIGVDGIVVTNTTNQRPDDLISRHRQEAGGLSGQPIRDRSTECIRTLYRLTDGEIPIIGVGGIGSGHDAYEKLKAGASLVQVYSMMVYKGPGVVSRIRNELAELMVLNGQRSIEDVIGADHDAIHWRKRKERLITRRQSANVIKME